MQLSWGSLNLYIAHAKRAFTTYHLKIYFKLLPLLRQIFQTTPNQTRTNFLSSSPLTPQWCSPHIVLTLATSVINHSYTYSFGCKHKKHYEEEIAIFQTISLKIRLLQTNIFLFAFKSIIIFKLPLSITSSLLKILGIRVYWNIMEIWGSNPGPGSNFSLEFKLKHQVFCILYVLLVLYINEVDL